MKKISLFLALGYIIFAIVTIVACQSAQTNIDNSQEKVNVAKHDIRMLNAVVTLEPAYTAR